MELYIQDRRSAMRDSTLDASPLCSVGQSSLNVAPVLNLFSGRGRLPQSCQDVINYTN